VRKRRPGAGPIRSAPRKLAWKKVLLPVHREQAPRIGRDTIDAIYKATGFDPSKL